MLVGHDLHHDFSVLHSNAEQWSVVVRDTALSRSLRERAALDLGMKPSLRTLSRVLLGRTIQSGSHCSKEDAKVCPRSLLCRLCCCSTASSDTPQAALDLYLKFRDEMDKEAEASSR